MNLTFPELGIVYVKRGSRGVCRGSGLPMSTRGGTAGRCPQCDRALRVTYHRRLPVHMKHVETQGRRR